MARPGTAGSYDAQGADPRLLAELNSARNRLATLTAAFERGEVNLASLRTDRYLRHLFDADIIGILFTDSDGQIARANDLFLQMVGYGADELPLCWRALTPPDWRDKDRTKTHELKEVGRVVPWETEIYHRDGLDDRRGASSPNS